MIKEYIRKIIIKENKVWAIKFVSEALRNQLHGQMMIAFDRRLYGEDFINDIVSRINAKQLDRR